MTWATRWRERFRRYREYLCMGLAWALPLRVAYWAFIRVATWKYPEHPAFRTVAEAQARWEGRMGDLDPPPAK